MKKTAFLFITALIYGTAAFCPNAAQSAQTGIAHRFNITVFHENTSDKVTNKHLYKKRGIESGFVIDQTEHIEAGVRLGLTDGTYGVLGAYGKFNFKGVSLSDLIAMHPYAKYTREKWQETNIWVDAFSIGIDLSLGTERNFIAGLETKWEQPEHDSDGHTKHLYGLRFGWRFGHNSAVTPVAVPNIILQHNVNGMPDNEWRKITGGSELNFGSQQSSRTIGFGVYGNQWFAR
ncbi:MAG: hypothetical protein J5706_07890 [Elusimicrobiales bacterium]|nr:hypothetical protein [Elusimicrobiales bacterium]